METEYETLRDGVVKALNLDWDDMQDGWWLPADPGPILCHTILEAVEEALRLGENDERRLRDEVASLTARAVRAEGAMTTPINAVTEAEAFAAKYIIALESRLATLESALGDLIDKYDWWQVDPVDRESIANEIETARAALAPRPATP